MAHSHTLTAGLPPPAPPPNMIDPSTLIPPPPPGARVQTTTSYTTVQVQPNQYQYQWSSAIRWESKPRNYVALSVVTLIFFCWVFGLLGLITGLKVSIIMARHGVCTDLSSIPLQEGPNFIPKSSLNVQSQLYVHYCRNQSKFHQFAL